MIKEIGIIGQGFVGGSINSFFKNKLETHTFDLNRKCTCSSLDELVKKSELIFSHTENLSVYINGYTINTNDHQFPVKLIIKPTNPPSLVIQRFKPLQ